MTPYSIKSTPRGGPHQGEPHHIARAHAKYAAPIAATTWLVCTVLWGASALLWHRADPSLKARHAQSSSPHDDTSRRASAPAGATISFALRARPLSPEALDVQRALRARALDYEACFKPSGAPFAKVSFALHVTPSTSHDASSLRARVVRSSLDEGISEEIIECLTSRLERVALPSYTGSFSAPFHVLYDPRDG